jgi:hypothetical protein
MSRFNGLSLRSALAGAAFVTVGALGATPASAEGAWCAQYGGSSSGSATNCGFYTFEQCRAAISGVGGFCSHTPYKWYEEVIAPPKPRRR